MGINERIFIKNCTERDMHEVLFCVINIIRAGRISCRERAYCRLTSFNNGLLVVAKRNKNSDTFIILEEE